MAAVDRFDTTYAVGAATLYPTLKDQGVVSTVLTTVNGAPAALMSVDGGVRLSWAPSPGVVAVLSSMSLGQFAQGPLSSSELVDVAERSVKRLDGAEWQKVSGN